MFGTPIFANKNQSQSTNDLVLAATQLYF